MELFRTEVYQPYIDSVKRMGGLLTVYGVQITVVL